MNVLRSIRKNIKKKRNKENAKNISRQRAVRNSFNLENLEPRLLLSAESEWASNLTNLDLFNTFLFAFRI